VRRWLVGELEKEFLLQPQRLPGEFRLAQARDAEILLDIDVQNACCQLATGGTPRCRLGGDDPDGGIANRGSRQ